MQKLQPFKVLTSNSNVAGSSTFRRDTVVVRAQLETWSCLRSILQTKKKSHLIFGLMVWLASMYASSCFSVGQVFNTIILMDDFQKCSCLGHFCHRFHRLPRISNQPVRLWGESLTTILVFRTINWSFVISFAVSGSILAASLGALFGASYSTFCESTRNLFV